MGGTSVAGVGDTANGTRSLAGGLGERRRDLGFGRPSVVF
ncbi:unnamed protein product [Ectocarpus sp. CCAP 1310/34]|nr:unnamed protein product [Ectocarpus sp. CCAP 1310/34]